MKTFSTIILLFIMMCSSGMAQDVKIWDRVDNCFDALHEYNAEAFAANFTEDATLIAPFGKIMRGKEDILETHQKVFEQWGSPPKNVMEKQSNKKVEYLTPDLALITFYNTTKGDEARGDREVSYTILLKEVGVEWKVHAVQMTPVQTIQ